MVLKLLKTFLYFLYTYIKMVNKYHQKNKSFKKKHKKDIKIFLKKKKKKSISIIVIELRIFLKKKNKKRLNI